MTGRLITHNYDRLPDPPKLLAAVKPRDANFTHCWAKRLCDGDRLPEERETGGVCAKCVAPQKAASPVAVARITVGDPVGKRFVRGVTTQKRRVAVRAPLLNLPKMHQREKSMRGWGESKRHKRTPTTPDAQLAKEHGMCRRLSDTVYTEMRVGTKRLTRASLVVQCVKDLGGCDRAPFSIDRGKWARRYDSVSACPDCYVKVELKRKAKATKARYDRRVRREARLAA